jgi:FkbM family methyltransferase
MKKLLHSLISVLARTGVLFLFRNKLPFSIYQHLHFHGPFTFKVEGKPVRMMHYGTIIENGLYWEGLKGFEPVSLGLWAKLCKLSDTIIDVGANTGVFSLVAGAANPKAHIYAFEPSERILSKLKRNIDLNGFSVYPVGLGVSNKTGSFTFYDTLDEHNTSASLSPDMNLKGKIEVTINTITLDEFLQPKFIRPDLVKIDVEKHEAEVIEGFLQSIKKYHPTILIELLSDSIAARVQELIKDVPYQYYSISEEKGIKRADKLSQSEGYNFLICTEEVAKMIGVS